MGAIASIVGADVGSPQVGSAVDYTSGQVLVKDYAARTYSSLTLADYVSQQKTVQALEGTTVTQPTPTLERTSLRQLIAGIPAHAYLSTLGDLTTRVWYAEGLPLPPPDVRRKLAAIGPLPCEKSECDDDAPIDDDAGDAEDDGQPHAFELAGRTVLRTEKRDSAGTWTIVNDTLSSTKTSLSAADFAAPAGWAQTTLPSVPPSVPPAFGATQCSASDEPSTSIALAYSGGALLKNPNVYLHYFGPNFQAAHDASPADFDARFTAGISQVFSSAYGGLGQYGFQSGKIVKEVVSSATVPGAFSDFLVDQATVLALQYTGEVPDLWWWTDSRQPLVFLVYEQGQVGGAEYGGYHVAAPSASWIFLPFPVNVFAAPFVPYAAAEVPDDAFKATASDVAARDTKCGGSLARVQSLDEGTISMSHELMEAITDPFEFSGWAVPLTSVPNGDQPHNGEVCDVCDLRCSSWSTMKHEVRTARVGTTVLSTYWSNADGACMPAWHPHISIVSFENGSTVPYSPSGTKVAASIDNPLNGGCDFSVSWTVDGASKQLGNPTTFPASVMSPGFHTVVASYTDPVTGVPATTSATVNVACPTDQTALCHGKCTDLDSDAANCGSCGNACATSAGQSCISGTCQCPFGQATCGGSCTDVQANNSNCGSCGNACPYATTCHAGVCENGRECTFFYTNQSATVVYDARVGGSGLYWQKTATDVTTYDAAQTACQAIGPNWRLPSRTELDKFAKPTYPQSAGFSVTTAAADCGLSLRLPGVPTNDARFAPQERFWTTDTYSGDVGPGPTCTAYQWQYDLLQGLLDGVSCPDDATARGLCTSATP